MFDLSPLQQVRVQNPVPAVGIDRRQPSSLPPPADVVRRLSFGATVLCHVPHVIRSPEQLQGTEEQPVQPNQDEGAEPGDDACRSARRNPGQTRLPPRLVPETSGVRRGPLGEKHGTHCHPHHRSHLPRGHLRCVHAGSTLETSRTSSRNRPHPAPILSLCLALGLFIFSEFTRACQPTRDRLGALHGNGRFV